MFSCLQISHLPIVCLCVPATSHQQIFLLHIKITTTSHTFTYFTNGPYYQLLQQSKRIYLNKPCFTFTYRNSQIYYCMSFLLLTLLGLPCGDGLAEDDTLDPDRCRAPNE